MAIFRNILEMIGQTPLLHLRTFDTGPCELLVKMESYNPGGSIKDRIGQSMIEAAEREGRIKPGALLVEATAGNTGLGLALVAAQKGYKLLLVIPDKMSQEKIQHLRALGTQIVITRSDVGRGHPQYYQDMAERITGQTPGAYYVNQFNNPANPLAHETTTAPEIWTQSNHEVDAVVAGVGSGGTLAGVARFFERVKPEVEMVLADPVGSILAGYVQDGTIGKPGSWLVEGIGEDFIPPIADLSRVRKAYSVSDAESALTTRKLLEQEGILAGSSSGTLVAAAVRYCREQTRPKRVVTFICDSGNKYLSKVYNNFWLADQGLVAREPLGDLRDLILHRQEEGAVVAVEPGDSLMVAYTRMRLHDVSQMPVLEGGRLVGIIDESDLLLRTFAQSAAFDETVSEVMTRNVQTVPRTAAVDELIPILDSGRVVVVSDDTGFHGLITRIDVLNFLRKRHKGKKRG